jgi:hypothetical protein
MPDESEKTVRARCDDIYRLIRIDTERAITKLVTALRDRSDDAVDRYMHVAGVDSDDGDDSEPTEAELDRITEIRLSHSMAFAHALLQGAADAFEDQKTGLTLLKRLIDVELTELEQDACFVQEATTAGSNAIN